MCRQRRRHIERSKYSPAVASRLGQSIDIRDFDLNSAESSGQQVVYGSEDNEEDESKNRHDDWHQNVNDCHHLDLLPSEYEHWNSDQRVNKAHQNIERHDDLARLQNGDSGQLLFHEYGPV